MNPAKWLIDNQDLWDNVGDHIEFHCPLEQVPEAVLEAADAYAQNIKQSHEQWLIMNKMGLTEQTIELPK